MVSHDENSNLRVIFFFKYHYEGHLDLTHVVSEPGSNDLQFNVPEAHYAH